MTVELNKTLIQYGDRYSDDSGWERFAQFDFRQNEAILRFQSCELRMPIDELEWYAFALQEAIKQAVERGAI